ncbi:MAG: hypothetical protein M0Z52_07560 [Actinomycetota bacterium]|nr:hypothetical protein [Actinomycetota bacterium]
MPDYIYEITHNYRGPIDGIVEYLQKHANKGDVVAITYGDMPVKFYTGLRVVGGLTGEDLTPAKNADWVIIRRHVICEKDMRVRKFLLAEVPLGKYDPIVLNYPDLPFENREDPAQHLFRTAKDYPVVIFHRRWTPLRLTGTASGR